MQLYVLPVKIECIVYTHEVRTKKVGCLSSVWCESSYNKVNTADICMIILPDSLNHSFKRKNWLVFITFKRTKKEDEEE